MKQIVYTSTQFFFFLKLIFKSYHTYETNCQISILLSIVATFIHAHHPKLIRTFRKCTVFHIEQCLVNNEFFKIFNSNYLLIKIGALSVSFIHLGPVINCYLNK